MFNGSDTGEGANRNSVLWKPHLYTINFSHSYKNPRNTPHSGIYLSLLDIITTVSTYLSSSKHKFISSSIIGSLNLIDFSYIKRKADLDDRLYRMYDKIEDVEAKLIETRAKKQAVEAEKLTGDNIYKVLLYFETVYCDSIHFAVDLFLHHCRKLRIAN